MRLRLRIVRIPQTSATVVTGHVTIDFIVIGTVLPATMSRKCAVATERQKLEEEVNALMVAIQGNESKLIKVNQENEVHLGNMKEILKKKDDTMEERRKVDGQLQALNDEITTKRETLVRLQGNLQYKKEDKINEAIRRLEYQLAANNYRVSEEIKIVQEIDRLKRSKKSLRQYLSAKDELDGMKHKMLTARNDRDVLCRQVTVFRTNEEELKRNLRENRCLSESFRKDLDDLIVKKRKTISELKQLAQTQLHLKELQPKRTQSFKRKEENVGTTTRMSPQEGTRPFQRKARGVCCDPFSKRLLLCSTLVTYLQRLAVASTPTTPVSEQQPLVGTCVAPEIVEGDSVMVLLRREECVELFASKKGNRKGKKEKKKCHANKTLSHSAEVFVQFGELGLEPPATVADVNPSLDALVAKKELIENERREAFEQKQSPSEEMPLKVSPDPFNDNKARKDKSLDCRDRTGSITALELVDESSKVGDVYAAVERLDTDRDDIIERLPSLDRVSSDIPSPLEAIETGDSCLSLVNGCRSVPTIVVQLVDDDDSVTVVNGLNGAIAVELIDVMPPSKSKAFAMSESADFNVVHFNGSSAAVGTNG